MALWTSSSAAVRETATTPPAITITPISGSASGSKEVRTACGDYTGRGAQIPRRAAADETKRNDVWEGRMIKERNRSNIFSPKRK